MELTMPNKDNFIKSDRFNEIVDSLLEFEKKTIRIDAEDSESDDEEVEVNEDDGAIGEQNCTANKSLERREEIARDMIRFITKSNEKWILDQFNLCKKFLIQNSIEGHYDEFAHPVYENFSHIKSMKEKWCDSKAVGKNYKTFTNMVKSTQSGITEAITVKSLNGDISEKHSSKTHSQNPTGIVNLEVRKTDVFSLLLTIEEVENKIRLNKILTKINAKDNEEDDEICQRNDSRAVRLLLSMLNYSRNFAAVKFAQDHPSDEKNQI